MSNIYLQIIVNHYGVLCVCVYIYIIALKKEHDHINSQIFVVKIWNKYRFTFNLFNYLLHKDFFKIHNSIFKTQFKIPSCLSI